MRRFIRLGAPLIAFAVMGSMALAQEQSQQAPTTDHSAHHGQMDQPTGQPSMGGGPMMGGMMDQGMMGQQTMGSGQPGQQTGQQMMGCPMMGGMMGQSKQGMMGQGGMGTGMMRGGMGALFGSRVTPMMNLSAEDVRGYLDAQLDRLNNKRLKVGDVKSDDGTIIADIVTVDNSLVQRLKVNRHTGAIEYQN
jgi:hypothetical protein